MPTATIPEAPVGPPTLDVVGPLPRRPGGSRASMRDSWRNSPGHLSIAAALRPHEGVGQDQAHRSLSTAINAITISFHGDVRADRWMLYHHLSTFAGDGMTHSECRVHDEPGNLIASFTVEAMVRPFPRRRRYARRTYGTMSLTTGKGPLERAPGGTIHRPHAGTRHVHRALPTACPGHPARLHPDRQRTGPARPSARTTAELCLSGRRRRRPTDRARDRFTGLCDRGVGRRRLVVRGGRAGVRASAEPVPPGRLPPITAPAAGRGCEASPSSTRLTPSPSTRPLWSPVSMSTPGTSASTSWLGAHHRRTAPTRARRRIGLPAWAMPPSTTSRGATRNRFPSPSPCGTS